MDHDLTFNADNDKLDNLICLAWALLFVAIAAFVLVTLWLWPGLYGQ